MLKSSNKSSVIQTIIQTDEQHPLQTLFNQKPELLQPLVSIGLIKLPDSNKFCSYVIKSLGDKIISIEVTEPDFRAVAEETSKINFVELFMQKEF